MATENQRARINDVIEVKKSVYYVKTEIFPRELGRKIGKPEEIRHASDYDDFYIASREEAERQIAVADEFIQQRLDRESSKLKGFRSYYLFRDVTVM